ncbi:MAG: toll/interleukin-1 receptor domain-containing protein [Xenococcaceae cyanobacterium]
MLGEEAASNSVMFKDVFISYSRKDKEFVQALRKALQEYNRDTWVDWQNIPLTAEWWKEIEAGIEAADTFVFVISSDSLASEYCGKEINHALKYGKRLVPIVWRDDFDDKQVHPKLSKYNWLFFRESDDFDSSFQKLIKAIDTDLNYIRFHTHLLVRAREWENKGRTQDFLLRGNNLVEARKWLWQAEKDKEKEPRPKPPLIQYIEESVKTETANKRKRMVFGVVAVAAIASVAFFFNLSRNAAISELKALLAFSGSRFTSTQKIDALVTSLKAGQKLKQSQFIFINKPEYKAQVITALLQSSNWIKQSNHLEGHESTVFSVSFSPDGEIIASASEDDTIKLWKRDGRLLRSLEAHSDDVVSVIFSPDGQTFASASYDKTIKLWTRDGTLIETLVGHIGPITSVSFSPDGKIIASASEDKTIKLWKRDGTVLDTLYGHSYTVNHVSFSPDGQRIVSASLDNTIKLWKRDGTLLTTLEGHQGLITSVSLSPDGEIIASASRDKTIKLWKRDGTLLTTLEGHRDIIYQVRFSPDGEIIASASRDKTIKLWKRNGTMIATLEGYEGHCDAVYRVSFSPDGKMIASGSEDKTIKLWTRNGKLLDTFEDHRDGVIGISFSPDSKILASASYDNTVKLWKVEDLDEDNSSIKILNHGDDKVSGVIFSPKNSPKDQIISTSVRTVKLWQQDGTLSSTLKVFNKEENPDAHELGVEDIDISPDGQIFASASADGTVKLWRLDGTLIKTLKEHTDKVYSVNFSQDGQFLASASADKTVKLWKRDGKNQSYTYYKTLKGHEDQVLGVSFSPNGQILASASADNTVKLWKRDGIPLDTLEGHSDRVFSVSFSRDSQLLASASADGTIKLWKWDTRGRSYKYYKSLREHESRVLEVNFSPNGQLLASASADKTVKLWALDGTWLMDLKGHRMEVSKVSFSPDGKKLASASKDKTAILWQLPEKINHGHEQILDELLEHSCQLSYDYLNANYSNIKLDNITEQGRLEGVQKFRNIYNSQKERKEEFKKLRNFCQSYVSE